MFGIFAHYLTRPISMMLVWTYSVYTPSVDIFNILPGFLWQPLLICPSRLNRASAENDYQHNCRAQWEARQSPIVLGGEGQSLCTKDTLSIGPVHTHWSDGFINSVGYMSLFIHGKSLVKLKFKTKTNYNCFAWLPSGNPIYQQPSWYFV